MKKKRGRSAKSPRASGSNGVLRKRDGNTRRRSAAREQQQEEEAEKQDEEEEEEKRRRGREGKEEEEERSSAEDEKNAVCVHGSGGSDVCESRVRLAPVVVSVTSTGPGLRRAPGSSGPHCCGLRRVGPRAG